MKKFLVILLLAISFSSLQRAQAEVSLSFFYDSLEDDGDWFQADDYGYCWQPHGIDADWSPYSDGYWTYTDEGWTWVSYESFGWATYHYGRWVRLSGRGWVWVPGYEWGPAWVSWRSNDDYVGWAPLPPQAVCRPDEGIDDRVDADYDIGPSYYAFTTSRQFGSPSIRQVIVNRSENVTIINETTNITNISYRNDVIFNDGPDFERVNRRCERPIERLRLERITRFDDEEDRHDHRFNRRENGRLMVTAPRVVPVEERLQPRRIKASLGRVEVQRGWAGVRDAKLAERTRQKIRAEHPEKQRPQRPNRDQTAVLALRREARLQAVRADQVPNPVKNNRIPNRKNAAAPRAANPQTPAKIAAEGEANQRQNRGPENRQARPLPATPANNEPTPAERAANAQRRQQEQARINQQRAQAARQSPPPVDPEIQAQRARARAQREQATRQQEQAHINQQRAQAARQSPPPVDPEIQAQRARARAQREQATRQQEQAHINQQRAQAARQSPPPEDPAIQAQRARARAQREQEARQQNAALPSASAPNEAARAQRQQAMQQQRAAAARQQSQQPNSRQLADQARQNRIAPVQERKQPSEQEDSKSNKKKKKKDDNR